MEPDTHAEWAAAVQYRQIQRQPLRDGKEEELLSQRNIRKVLSPVHKDGLSHSSSVRSSAGKRSLEDESNSAR